MSCWYKVASFVAADSILGGREGGEGGGGLAGGGGGGQARVLNL